jgi:hypothetical protein
MAPHLFTNDRYESSVARISIEAKCSKSGGQIYERENANLEAKSKFSYPNDLLRGQMSLIWPLVVT